MNDVDDMNFPQDGAGNPSPEPRYRLVPRTKPLASTHRDARGRVRVVHADDGLDPRFIRAENEDDDGYDPYSDRTPATSLFEEDPWR